ncbi:hypothetical protein KP509_30G043200 [Ceratopteris richardii]|uniref:BED-type domain-containing protein n=1 Tax=Ceratopteris richardii TaxID=49495 RepID=A0A8T2R3N1_CERRI|nr:hypothetical protein KP509_30G043200 [Ceratopteris richardii]
MVKDKHEAFTLHCIGVEKDTKKSNSHHWTCKYCGKRYTSGATRLIQHLTKVGGQVAACKEIPDHIANDIRRKHLGLSSSGPSHVRGYNASPTQPSTHSNVPETSQDAQSHFQASNTPNISQSPTVRTSTYQRQGELGDAPGHTRTSLTWLKEKQKIADSEITKLVILENLSFNLLNSKQWKTTVKAISEVGPCQGWTGPSYSDLRRRKIDEEKKKIDLSLLPMREKWYRYGCTILSDGWRDRKNRSMINILVSGPIGTFFLRAVEVGKKGKKTTGAFIYRHIKKAIEETVVSPLWNDWDESSLEESKSMQRLCLDEEFWENVKAVLNILTPIYRVLRMTDCEGATLGLLIHMMRRAIDDIRAATLVTTEQVNEVLEVTLRRWTWMHRPIHGFAGLLHPAFKSPALYTDIELLSDRLSYMSRVIPSHLHNEMLEQISCYLDERGNSAFTFPSCWDRASMVKPLFWWQNFGFSFSTLSTYAIRVLSQDCSSGACERNWSAFSLVHTKVRNRLSPEQMEKLIYCRTNLRMLENIPNMETLKQVDVDTFWPLLSTMPRPGDEMHEDDEDFLFTELYRELSSIDGLIIRRGSSSTSMHGEEDGTSRAPLHTATYMRRTILPARHHSSQFDNEGNIISPIESPVPSTYEMTSEDSLDEPYDSDDDIE